MIQRLANWGNYPVMDCEVQDFTGEENWQPKDSEPIIARGMGRSYGDASLGKTICSMTRHNCMLEFQEDSGILWAESGVTLSEILETFVPRGYFLPVTPGTRFVSLGGAVAADVHGKNHHVEGSFCDHVAYLDLLTESGKIIRCSPTENSEWFNLTRGGMGLSGIILRVALKLKKIETSWIQQTNIKVRNFAELCELFQQHQSATYSVAWVDCLARGKSAGRGILMLGEHVSKKQAEAKGIKNLYTQIKKSGPKIPFFFPEFILNRLSIKIFNLLYYHKQLSRKSEFVTPFEPYFYPLDSIQHWNRVYGKRGFIQYQFVLPFEGGAEAMQQILETIAQRGFASFLTVLKVLGAQQGVLAFPMKGYTLALDFPVSDQLIDFLKELDVLVLAAKGRIYLAKDSRMSVQMFHQSYTEPAKQFQQQLQQLAPEKQFQSALSQRLQII
jgi:decaprenylphospho-beta-D-ribofuranose 2-oxidase